MPAPVSAPRTTMLPDFITTSKRSRLSDQRTSNAVPVTAMSYGPTSTCQSAPGWWTTANDARPRSSWMVAPLRVRALTRATLRAPTAIAVPSVKRAVAPAAAGVSKASLWVAKLPVSS